MLLSELPERGPGILWIPGDQWTRCRRVSGEVASGEGSLGHVQCVPASYPEGGWWAGRSPCIFPQGQTSRSLGAADRSRAVPENYLRLEVCAGCIGCGVGHWTRETEATYPETRSLFVSLSAYRYAQGPRSPRTSSSSAGDQVPGHSHPESWQPLIFCACELACSGGFLETASDIRVVFGPASRLVCMAMRVRAPSL